MRCLLWGLALGVTVSACLERRKRRDDGSGSASDLTRAQYSLYPKAWDDATAQAAARALGATFGSFVPENMARDQLVALSACPCLSSLAGPLLQSFTAAHGSVPQVLVPEIREQIKTNGKLQTLAKLGFLGNALKGVLATDERLNTEIRQGLNEKIAAAFPGADLLRPMPQFLFDGFVAGGGQRSDKSRMRVADVAARWLVTTAASGMWQGATPLRFGNHGLQLLNFVSVVNDWNYAFGLQSDVDKKPYGGLAFDAKAGASAAIGPMDPREDSAGAGILSGDYTVTIQPAKTALALVEGPREAWRRASAPVPLSEQALVWRSAAQAFHWLRPRASVALPKIFDDDKGFLPKEAVMLPLVWLPGMAYLLDGPFLDEKEHLIYHEALGGEKKEARLADKLALAQALALWSRELADVSDFARNSLYVPTAARLKEMKEGGEKLRTATQFVQQNILARNVSIGAPRADGTSAISLVDAGAEANLKTTAEALYTLAVLQKQFPSPLVASRLEGLFHAFMARVLVPRFATAQEPISVEEGVWTYNALAAYAELKGEAARAPWLPGALRSFQAALAAWGGEG